MTKQCTNNNRRHQNCRRRLRTCCRHQIHRENRHKFHRSVQSHKTNTRRSVHDAQENLRSATKISHSISATFHRRNTTYTNALLHYDGSRSQCWCTRHCTTSCLCTWRKTANSCLSLDTDDCVRRTPTHA